MNFFASGELLVKQALLARDPKDKFKRNKVVRNGKCLRTPLSREAIERIRLFNIGNKYCKGYKHTEEARKNMSMAHKNITISEEHRKKMIEGIKRHGPVTYVRTKEIVDKWRKTISETYKDPARRAKLSHPTSEESKKKISEANKGNKYNVGKHHTQQTKDTISRKKKKYFSYPENREKYKKMWEDKEFKERMMAVFNSQEYKQKLLKVKHPFISKPEYIVGDILHNIGIEYVSQHPITNIIDSYNCDFYIEKYNMIIEVDGAYWHNYPYGRDIDRRRNIELDRAGYRLLRIWDCDIHNAEDMIVSFIRNIDCSFMAIAV